MVEVQTKLWGYEEKSAFTLTPALSLKGEGALQVRS
jgi:hypothetical protein